MSMQRLAGQSQRLEEGARVVAALAAGFIRLNARYLFIADSSQVLELGLALAGLLDLRERPERDGLHGGACGLPSARRAWRWLFLLPLRFPRPRSAGSSLYKRRIWQRREEFRYCSLATRT